MRTVQSGAGLDRRVHAALWTGVLGGIVGLVYAWLLARHSYGDNYVYGRPLIFGVLLLLVGVLAWRRALPRTSRASRVCGGVVAVGLGSIALGIVGDYWIGARNDVTLWRLGFGFELLGSAVALLGTTMLGVLLLRARQVAPWLAWLMILVIPVGAALLAPMLGYIPSDPVGALCVVWGVACAWRAARQPVATS